MMNSTPATKYMLLDVTGGGCQLVLVAATKEVQMHARLLVADNPRRKLIAPPVEGRGFAKLTVVQLGELIKSLGASPFGEFEELCQQALKLMLAAPVDQCSIASLEHAIEKRGLPEPVIGWANDPTLAPAPVKAKKERSTEFTDPVRPKSGTTTGMIWDLCDALQKKLKQVPTSKEAWSVCEAEGVKQGTFSVQFGKWKKANGF